MGACCVGQVEDHLLAKIDEYDRRYPPRASPGLSPANVFAGGAEAAAKDTADAAAANSGGTVSSSLAATDAAAAAVAAGVAGVGEALRQRLDLPIHQRMNRASTRATLGYLFNHMRCGIYVMIRHGAVRMFVPFVNAAYTNSWSAALHWSGKGPGGERDGSDPELGQDVRGYYEAKQQRAGCREENVIPDVGEWWANGNIICNEHCPPGQDQSQYWGDQLLVLE